MVEKKKRVVKKKVVKKVEEDVKKIADNIAEPFHCKNCGNVWKEPYCGHCRVKL